jgi:L-lysine exporter family protein LysE/ArgO
MDLGLVNVATLRTALQQGGTAAFLLGVGSCIGDLIYFTLAGLGAAALTAWAPFRWALWLFGTSTMLFLAWRMAKEVVHPVVHPKDVDLGESVAGKRGLLFTGMGLALASPTAILWFAAVGGSVIASFGRERTTLASFAAGFALAGLAWAAAFAYGVAALRAVLGKTMMRGLSLVSALLFLYFAAVVFVRGLRDVTN